MLSQSELTSEGPPWRDLEKESSRPRIRNCGGSTTAEATVAGAGGAMRGGEVEVEGVASLAAVVTEAWSGGGWCSRFGGLDRERRIGVAFGRYTPGALAVSIRDQSVIHIHNKRATRVAVAHGTA